MMIVDLKHVKFYPFYCSSSLVLILHFFVFLWWLHIFYATVTNVSHHQPHRPTFKTTASTVSYHFHLHHACVCVWQKIERCCWGGALYSTQLPRGSRNHDSIITQERSKTLAGAAKCGGKGRSGFKCLSVSLWIKQMFIRHGKSSDFFTAQHVLIQKFVTTTN